MQCQLDEIKDNLQVAMEQKSTLKCHIATSNKTVEELKQRMFSAIKLLQKYIERDKIQVEHNNIVSEVGELRVSQKIKEATRNFDEALKIGEGDYGIIYYGLLRHNSSYKVLHPHSSLGSLKFQQEANILLDNNFAIKFSRFGMCCVLREDEFSDNTSSLCYRMDPKYTLAYIGPEFLATRDIIAKSDIYSFEIILLKLLTGKPATGRYGGYFNQQEHLVRHLVLDCYLKSSPRLQQSMEEVEISRHKVYEKSMKHMNAVKKGIEAARRVRA
nr:U-box domain-containing protein 33-like [Coffea arabica]